MTINDDYFNQSKHLVTDRLFKKKNMAYIIL